jgi:hypothetical protein
MLVLMYIKLLGEEYLLSDGAWLPRDEKHTRAGISAISWRPVLVVEEVGVPGENHRPWASNW